MADLPLYPLWFDPIYKSALWGGRRLYDLLGYSLPADELIGEAWVLSDQGDNQSRVGYGPLRGQTLRELLERSAVRLLGRDAGRHRRFPLLLKFIDAQDALSVQVHPNDRAAAQYRAGELGKTEAWVVLHADAGSRIYAGLQSGTGPDEMKRALREGKLPDRLHGFTPRPGDCVFIPAGTVHALGAGIVLFEIQQTSDITFRLYDWDRVDARTRRPRELHIEQSLACTDYAAGPRHPVVPAVESTAPVRRERLVACDYFTLARLHGDRPFPVGAPDACRILVGIEGQAEVEHRGQTYPIGSGDVLLLPAEVGICPCQPNGPVTLLDCAIGPGASP